MLFLRSLLFNLLMLSTIIVFAPVVSVVVFPFPYKMRHSALSQWPRFQVWLLKVICGLDYRIEGLEHLPQTACIVMSKHQSTWETFVYNVIFPPHVWVMKRELMWIPFFGWGMALLKPIAIDRSTGRKAVEQVIEQGQDRLNSGLWVIVFPEGTRIPANKRGRYKLGGAVLAAETGYPVVPIAHNSGTFWPRRSFLIYPGVVRLVIGPVITPEGKTPEQIRTEVENWIEDTMKSLEGRTEPAELFVR